MAEFVLPPDIVPHLADWTLIDYSGIHQSPFSGAMRTISRGQRWQAHYQFHDLIADKRAAIAGLMARIRGKSGRVWISDPTYIQRGSFPATEMFTNGAFVGAAGWSINGAATVVSVNRSLQFTTTASTAASLYQPVAVVNGVAYAVRSMLVDGFNSAGATLGDQVTDATPTSYPNVGLARGLITAPMMCAAGGSANQFPISVTAGATAGMIVICTYASMRRCALVVNPAGLTFSTVLTVKGLPTSTTGLLLSGDRCEINGEMKSVTFDLNSDASGNGILMFEPALRKIVPDNAPVIIGQPMMRGVLMNDPMQVTRPGVFSDFDFTFVEA